MQKLSGAIQEALVALLCFNDTPNGAKAVRALVDTRHYDVYYRDIAKEAAEFLDKYGKCSGEHTLDIVDALIQRNPDQKEQLNRIYQSLEQIRGELVPEFILGKAKVFCRKQNAKAIVQRVVPLLDKDDDSAINEIEALFAGASKQAIDISDPGILFNDPQQALEFMIQENSDQIPIGIPELDRLGICPARMKYMLVVSHTNAGKSVSASSRIWCPDRGYIQMRHIVAGFRRGSIPQVFGVERRIFKPKQTPILDVFSSGTKATCEIHLASGRIVSGFADTHPVLTWDGYRPTSELKVGDFVVGAKTLPLNGIATPAELEGCYAVGVLCGDGCLVAKDGPRLSVHINKLPVVPLVTKLLGAKPNRCLSDTGNAVELSYPRRCFSIIDAWGMKRVLSKHREVPRRIYELGVQAVAACLAGLFDTDGCASQNGKNLQFCTASYKLSEDYLTMLNVLGIYAFRKKKFVKLNGKVFTAWLIDIQDEASLSVFVTTVGRYGLNELKWTKLMNRSKEVRKGRGVSFLRLPAQAWERVRGLVKAKGLDGKAMFDYAGLKAGNPEQYLESLINRNTKIHPTIASRLAHFLNDPWLTRRAGNGFVYDPIVRIDWKAPEPCWDLSTAPETRSFLAEHVFTHNSWMAIHMGKTAMRFGFSVCHVTLEMSRKEVSQRYVQATFSIGQREADIATTRFKKDSLGRVTDFSMLKLKRPTLKDDGIYSTLTKKMKPLAKKPPLYIQHFPSGSLTIAKLKAYLDQMEAVHNFKPSLLIVDYPDLMEHSSERKRNDLEKLTVDLRGIAGERNIAVVGFSQVNEKKEGNVIKTGRSSEGRAKEFTADVILSLNQTEQEYDLGLMRLFCSKNRGEVKNVKVLISQALKCGQFVVESALMTENVYWGLVKNGGPDET